MEQISVTQCDDSAAVNPDAPLPPEDIAAYLDGRLTGSDLQRVEAALARNPEARAELVDASRLVSSLPPAQRRARKQWVWASGSAAAAAAAVLLAVAVPSLTRGPATTPVKTERRATLPTGAALRTIGPADGALVAQADVQFGWTSLAGATYQLTVTDAEGATIWKKSTADTTATLPDSVTLVATRSYYWNVDALAPDGSSATTGIHEPKVADK